MNNARQTAVETLEDIFTKGAYSNIALNHNLKSSSLDDLDKSLVTEIVYGTIRYKYTIDKILNKFIKKGIDKVDSRILNILRITIFQLKYLSKIPDFAAVNEAVNLSKRVSYYDSKFVNGVLRSYLRDKGESLNFNYIENLCYNYSFPQWMVKLFIEQYGDELAEYILKSLNITPKTTVRVNNIKSNYEDTWQKLKDLGYDISDGCICPEAIIINKGKSIESNPLFLNGYITVQDESAMLPAACMDLEENLTVYDMCSAPGGKTTHISELMNNTGKIVAFDVHKNKLSLIRSNADRLGITNIKCIEMDSSKLNIEYRNTADRILLDVPCSGLGIIKKKPEIKWNKNINELNSILQIQRNILMNSSRYLKKGGTMIYSTCTLNKEENEGNIDWFLKNNKNFILEPIFLGNLENIIYNSNGTMCILPNEYMDGFFIAKLRKQA